MKENISELDIRPFYKDERLEFMGCTIDSTGCVRVSLKSKTTECRCPKCGHLTQALHGTYHRTVQDLTILGHPTEVEITAHEYDCTNEDCEAKSIVEPLEGFVGYYGRFTERCEDFITITALETNCEGAAKILTAAGIKISGDTIIRMLKKRIDALDAEEAGSCIGVDDFATKKGNIYCTLICNESTHHPIAVLDGRDGNSLKEWLQNNKHVKMVTRDRASAYAKVINDELPDAMQVADRFHLHQNLLETIKKCVSEDLPHTIKVKPVSEPGQDVGFIDVDDLSEEDKASFIIEDDDSEESDRSDTGKKNRTNCG